MPSRCGGGRQVIGALNLFGGTAGSMADEDVRVVQALADVATIGLLQERAVRRGEVLAEQLQSAPEQPHHDRAGQGRAGAAPRRSPDEAFTLMRSYCRRHGLRLADIAGAVIVDPASVPELTESPAFGWCARLMMTMDSLGG